MKAVRAFVWIAPLLLTVAGCNPFKNYTYACHKKQPYMEATSIAPLKIPPGLDPPDSTNALHLPALNEPPPPPRKGHEPCLDEPPPYKVQKAPQA